MKPSRTLLMLVPFVLSAAETARGQQGQITKSASETQMPVVFSGGHETDPRDRGRPVALVAGALGVPPEVFREAFSHVRPAPAGTEPDPQQVRQNKAALMGALRRYGINNERLDTVSNYYRYVRSRGERWPAKSASGYAVVKDGMIIRYVLTSGGSGYSSPPTVTVPMFPGAAGKAQIAFSRNFDQNGAVSAIVITNGKAEPQPASAP